MSFTALADFEFPRDMIKVLHDEAFDQDFVLMLERAATIGDKLADDPVVLPAAHLRTVLAEVEHFGAEADVGSAGGLVVAVFGQLFFGVNHGGRLAKSCN